MSKGAIIFRTAMRLAKLHPVAMGIVDEVARHMRLIAKGVGPDAACVLFVTSSGSVVFSVERIDSGRIMYEAATLEGQASIGTILTRDATPEPKKD